MLELLSRPWPWYVAGPLLGLFAPLLLLLGNKLFGISSNLRHACAAVLPGDIAYFRYDWRREGGWNLVFALGILVGGFLARWVFANPEPVAIAAKTRGDLAALGIRDFGGLVPDDLFSWSALLSVRGLLERRVCRFGVCGVGGFPFNREDFHAASLLCGSTRARSGRV
jgi:uncharacterized membrane protein YedE/YeeE